MDNKGYQRKISPNNIKNSKYNIKTRYEHQEKKTIEIEEKKAPTWLNKKGKNEIHWNTKESCEKRGTG